jgi:dipeptidyl aminopeptidase/acylaminoacyl peptidase
MSPLCHAHKINEQLLPTDGEADNNAGTVPVQSERMYLAVRGNGGTVWVVMLPRESHGYASRESVEYVPVRDDRLVRAVREERYDAVARGAGER